MNADYLELTDLTVSFDGFVAVDSVNLSVLPGDLRFLIGPNGAGKTTLIDAVSGLVKATGSARFGGHELVGQKVHRIARLGVGRTFQTATVFEELSVLQVVVGGKRNGPALIDEVLDLFPVLRDLLTRRAGLLSGGQRQQLAIARALITEPRLLILDEPTEGIQPSVVAEIERTIIALTERGELSVLLVEQHVGFALNAAGRYYVLASGRVTAEGSGGTTASTDVRAAMAI